MPKLNTDIPNPIPFPGVDATGDRETRILRVLEEIDQGLSELEAQADADLELFEEAAEPLKLSRFLVEDDDDRPWAA